jgi:hypothetical protein
VKWVDVEGDYYLVVPGADGILAHFMPSLKEVIFPKIGPHFSGVTVEYKASGLTDEEIRYDARAICREMFS